MQAQNTKDEPVILLQDKVLSSNLSVPEGVANGPSQARQRAIREGRYYC